MKTAISLNAEQISDTIKTGQSEANEIIRLINNQICSLPITSEEVFRLELRSKLLSYLLPENGFNSIKKL